MMTFDANELVLAVNLADLQDKHPAFVYFEFTVALLSGGRSSQPARSASGKGDSLLSEKNRSYNNTCARTLSDKTQGAH